jgi:hypothetical protein
MVAVRVWIWGSTFMAGASDFDRHDGYTNNLMNR